MSLVELEHILEPNISGRNIRSPSAPTFVFPITIMNAKYHAFLPLYFAIGKLVIQITCV